ncbi:MAG: mechanosensitive ion channel family protein [Thermodesulfobacteriota bacterium]|nr:mechanosensitive ion channel family protein [Thermodesulfobacteriota bacterium]
MMKNFLEILQHQIHSIVENYSKLLPLFAILLGALTAWWVLNMVIRRFEKKAAQKQLEEKYLMIFGIIKQAGHYTILSLSGLGIIKFFDLPMLERIVYAFIILFICIFTNRTAQYIIPILEKKLASKTKTHLDDMVFELSKKFSGVIILTIGILLALDTIGLNIMPFVAGAGVAGIAIGFAAKDTLSNLIAGILLIIDRPFEIGDRIEVWSAPNNSATWGDVIDIGLRATKIQTTDNIVIVIPNNEIMKRDIINYTTITKEIRVRIPIGIAYDADVDKAKEVISNISLELDWVMRNPGPKVVVKSFGDSAVNLEARIWISDPRKRMDTISYISDRVKDAFQKEGIEIPFPKRDIYIKKSES